MRSWIVRYVPTEIQIEEKQVNDVCIDIEGLWNKQSRESDTRLLYIELEFNYQVLSTNQTKKSNDQSRECKRTPQANGKELKGHMKPTVWGNTNIS
jgi:hypothetical protein